MTVSSGAWFVIYSVMGNVLPAIPAVHRTVQHVQQVSIALQRLPWRAKLKFLLVAFPHILLF
jgi:hypothetical protein